MSARCGGRGGRKVRLAPGETATEIRLAGTTVPNELDAEALLDTGTPLRPSSAQRSGRGRSRARCGGRGGGSVRLAKGETDSEMRLSLPAGAADGVRDELALVPVLLPMLMLRLKGTDTSILASLDGMARLTEAKDPPGVGRMGRAAVGDNCSLMGAGRCREGMRSLCADEGTDMGRGELSRA